MRQLDKVLSSPTLARRLLRGILPVVVVSLLIVAMTNYFFARREIADDIQNQIRTIAHQLALNVESFIKQRRRDLETLSDSPLFVDHWKNVKYGLEIEAGDFRKRIENLFLSFGNRAEVYQKIAYCDREGRLIAGVQRGRTLKRGTYRFEAVDTLEKTEFYRSEVRSEEGRRLMTFARPLLNEEGERSGYLVLECDLGRLLETLRQARVGAKGAASIVHANSMQSVLGSPKGGENVLRQRVRVRGLLWQVLVEADAAEFVQPLVRLRDVTIAIALATGLIVMLTVSSGIRRATRPIREMVEGTRRLAGGDLDHRVRVPSTKELAELGVAFNDMAENLRARNEELETRIRQLTALRRMETSILQRRSEEAILRTCLEAIADGLSFDRTGLYWVDQESQSISGRYLYRSENTGLTEAAFQKRRITLGEDDILNRVIRSREPLLVTQPEEQPHVNPAYVAEAHTRQFVIAPLCGKRGVFGVIVADNCYSQRTLTESDRNSLMLFASAAGLALDNTLLVQELAESEARHRAVLENSPVAIIGVSREQRITTWNRGAEDIFGYADQQMLGEPLASLFSEAAPEQFDSLVNKVVQDGAVKEFEIKAANASGQPLELSICWGGTERDFWKNKEWTVVIRDVTEEKRLQRQLIASEKLGAVGQLIAGIAHELNNPLQAVVGFAELLMRPERRVQKKDLRHIYENASRCRKIIQNLLLFVRQGSVSKETIGLKRVVEAVLDLLDHKLRRVPELRVETDLPDDEIHTHGNFQQLEQVLVNLINNACDALEDWSGGRELTIRLRPDGEWVELEIADSGPGLPEEKRNRIFEPLFTTKDEGRGTGLGLPLVRQIVEDHEGTITVGESDAGGAAFRVALPVVEPAEAEEQDDDADPATTSSQRILVVDDEGSVRGLLQDVLEMDGHQVVAAESVEQAVEVSQQNRFDLVVSDLHLDDGTGVELFQDWSRRIDMPRPPFLLLTGDIVNETLESTCKAAGMRWLRKPLDLRELRRTVSSILERGASPDPAATP